MSNYLNAISQTALLTQWGFDCDVFNADEARKETRLESVMEYPEWFFEVLGNIKNLNFIIITGPRGAGKSSIRRSIEAHCRNSIGNDILGGNVLCINIDHDSPNWVKNFVLNTKKPSVDYFCEEILDQLIVAVLTYSHIEDIKKVLDKKEAFFLERHIYRLQEKRPDDISIMADRLLSKYKKLRNNDTIKDWVGILSEFFGNRVSFENRKIETPAIDDLPTVLQIVKKCGFDAIYVLVDEIDEYDLTTGKPDFAAEIVVPILSSINLLEKESLGLKFFLSAPVYQRLNKTSKSMNMEIRYDRTLQPDPYVLEWSDDNIATMLKRRLMSYSDNKINSLNAFCASDIIDIDKEIVKYSFRNPRHMIQLCDRIVRYTARNANANAYRITKDTLDNALKDFCHWVTKNIYPEEMLNAVISFCKTRFLDKEFANYNDITIDNSREVLDELTRLGALTSTSKLNGEKTYTVCDPRITYLFEG